MTSPYHANPIGIPAAKIDKQGPLYKVEDVVEYVANAVNAESHFEQRSKRMTADYKAATEKTDAVVKEFRRSMDDLSKVEKDFADGAKRASGQVRDAAEKLAVGLQRIEKTANFDRLERYVELLERASKAMTTLAELQSNGKLEKIASAIR